MNTDERPWDEETNRPVWRQEINTDMKNEPVLSPNETGEFPLSVFRDSQDSAMKCSQTFLSVRARVM